MSLKLKKSMAVKEFIDYAKLHVKNNLATKAKDYELTESQIQKIAFLIEASLDQTLDTGINLIAKIK